MNVKIMIMILVIGLVSSSGATVFAQVAPYIPALGSPLFQLNSGIKIQDIRCQPTFTLVIKSENSHPACVKESTALRLVSLNWGIISQTQNTQVNTEESPTSANNNFAFSFFSKVSNQDKNVFFSPYSISDAFSMVYEGAKGSTASQLQSVFGFIQDDTTRKNTIKLQNSQLASSDKYQLSTANAFWVQKDYPILSSYTDTLQNYYQSQITNLDLKGDSENSRITINKWVENKTNQKIVDLLPPDSINRNTRAVLTNAIYFKANWTDQFMPQETSNQTFNITQNSTVQVPMMTQYTTFPYYEDNTIQALEMPYKGDRLSMIILLPKDDIKSLDGMLSQDKFKSWYDNLSQTQVKVYIPKFKLETEYMLSDYLKSMGINDAFDPNLADFSGITGNTDLSISTAVHKAYVKVDENGTEAAAATGLVAEATAMPIYKHEFRADHPFVFFTYDKQTGLILFMGQLIDPTVQ